jgi:hypothetical protein
LVRGIPDASSPDQVRDWEKALRAGRVELARRCLGLIRDIADRGACAWDAEEAIYALMELRQVLSDPTGEEEQTIETRSAEEVSDAEDLYRELFFADCACRDMVRPH